VSFLYPLRAILTFILVMISWVFFRAADFHQSVLVIRRMFTGTRGPMLFEPWHIGLAVFALVVALCEEHFELLERAMRARVLVYASAMTVMLFCIEIFGVIDASIPFVYFQF
jgi:hypothetical protein